MEVVRCFAALLPDNIRVALGRADTGPDAVAPSTWPAREAARLARLRPAVARNRLAASLAAEHTLLRAVIGDQLACGRLVHRDDAAPLIPGRPDVSVSLSRSGNWTGLAIAPKASRIGLDIEESRQIDWRPVCAIIAERSEAARLVAADDAELFLRAWTIKEAVLKADGRGLRAGPKSVQLPDAVFSGDGQLELTAFGHRYTVWIGRHGHVHLALALSASQ